MGACVGTCTGFGLILGVSLLAAVAAAGVAGDRRERVATAAREKTGTARRDKRQKRRSRHKGLR